MYRILVTLLIVFFVHSLYAQTDGDSTQVMATDTTRQSIPEEEWEFDFSDDMPEADVEEEEEEKALEFYSVQQKAEFPGGEEALYKFIAGSVQYPAIALEEDYQGMVLLQFIIEKDGSVSTVKVLRSTSTHISDGSKKSKLTEEEKVELEERLTIVTKLAFEREAIRVVEEMPKWSPAIQRDKPVRMQFRLPIQFKMY